MSREEDDVYLGHMLDMTRRAIAALQNKSRADYDADDILRMGLAHLIQVIGEAARKVSPEFQTSHPEIPWRQIIGLDLTPGPSPIKGEGGLFAARVPLSPCGSSKKGRFAKGQGEG